MKRILSLVEHLQKFRVDYWGGDYDFITLADVDTDLYMLNPDAEEKNNRRSDRGMWQYGISAKKAHY